MRPGHDLDLWTAASASVSGLSMAVASPIWGVLGDLYGRKPMLIRSMLGGAITVGLIFFAQNPTELLLATAIATAQAPVPNPTNKTGVIGLMHAIHSTNDVDKTLAFYQAVFGLRLVFLAGGILLLLSLIPVLFIVRESPRVRQRGPRVSTLALIDQRPGLKQQLAVLIGAQGLINMCNAATQILVVLRLIDMVTAGVSAVSGIGFGLAGIASSAAAIGYTRVTSRIGYVRTAAGAAGLVAFAVALVGIAPVPALVVAGIALNGLFSGVVIPATASMIGLDTPHEAQSTVFGFNASSVAFGFFLGPLIAGTVASTSGHPAALFVIAALALVLAAILATGAREPSR